jgi:hypothetical protein
MKIKALHQYAKDVDTVFGLFHDPDFMTVKYQGIGARNVEVLECAGSEGRYTVKVKREVPADVPALLKKFLNPWHTIVQSETWEGKAGGPLSLQDQPRYFRRAGQHEWGYGVANPGWRLRQRRAPGGQVWDSAGQRQAGQFRGQRRRKSHPSRI